MASLPSGKKSDEADLAYALKLLALPRALGAHPDDKKDVIAAYGKFGPYVKWGAEIRSLPKDMGDPLDITLDRAVELLRQPKGRNRAAARIEILKQVGKHPVTEKDVKVLSGRFGPYVTDGEINASLPLGLKPEEITMDDAVALLQARAERIAAGVGVKRPRKPAVKKVAKKTRPAVKKPSGKRAPGGA